MKELAELRRFLPTALLDGKGWDRLLARVCDLPGDALEHCGFESAALASASCIEAFEHLRASR